MKRLPSNPNQYLNELQRIMSIEAAKKAAHRERLEKLKRKSLQDSIDTMANNGWVDVYTNQVPYELDVLRTNLYSKVDIGWFIRTVLGTGLNNPLFAAGLACTPVSPPGLSVDVGPGIIYYFSELLSSDYSVIPADSDPDHQIYKSYISFDSDNFSTPAPLVPGNSVIHLIQAAQESKDVNVVNRPYFNSADPESPIFENQPDTLQDLTTVGVKHGVEAVSPIAPTPDPGYTALYYVSVVYGQTSIISGDITVVPGAPFITESLTQKTSNQQEQNSENVYAQDTGTAGALVANPTPAYGTPQNGTRILVRAANNNGGITTLNVSGEGAVEVKQVEAGGLVSLSGGEIQVPGIYEFIRNGTVWQIMNPSQSDNGLPVGTVLASGGDTVDEGFLPWIGNLYNRATYSALFAKLGEKWGAGDGSTTFQVGPTNPRRTMVGAGGTGTGVLGNTVGSLGGEETHTLTIAETPSHAHEAGPTYSAFITETGGSTGGLTPGTGTIGFASETEAIGGGSAHNIMQPSMVVLHQVKY